MTGLTNRKKWVWIVSVLPLIWTMRMYFFGYRGFAYAPSYGWGMLDLHSYNSLLQTFILQMVPLILLACIIITICSSCRHTYTKVSVLSMLLLTLGTRVMIGLSSTLFGSGFRTMIPLTIALIFGGSVLVAELCEKRAKLQLILIMMCCIYFGISMYIYNLTDFLNVQH